MKEILLTFITDYSDKRTRPYAHAVTMQYIERYREEMNEDQVKAIFEIMLQFSKEFQKAWPWNRQKVALDYVRSLN